MYVVQLGRTCRKHGRALHRQAGREAAATGSNGLRPSDRSRVTLEPPPRRLSQSQGYSPLHASLAELDISSSLTLSTPSSCEFKLETAQTPLATVLI